MRNFQYVQELEEWLGKLGYEQFWFELAELGADTSARNDIDRQIAKGIVDTETALSCIKAATRLDLIKEFNLEYRDDMPVLLNEHSRF